MEPAKEDAQMEKYYKEHKHSILSAYLEKELKLKDRIILENDSFVALVPFWAVWPFESMIVSKRHFGSLLDMTDKEKNDFADAMKRLAIAARLLHADLGRDVALGEGGLERGRRRCGCRGATNCRSVEK
jgi:galactose-1-phosphate uridylyltransferase